MGVLHDEIISSISYIDSCVLEADASVIDAMYQAYEKSIMLLENYDGDDLSCFDIFQQESFVMESDISDKKENIIIEILMFIPRLIMKLVKLIKKAWDNRKIKKLTERIEQLEKLTEDQKLMIANQQEQINGMTNDDNLSKRIDGVEQRIDNTRRDLRKLGEATVRAKENLDDKINDVRVDIKRGEIADARLGAIIDVMNGVIETHIDFEKVNAYYNDIISVFEALDLWDIRKPSTLPKDTFNKINVDLENGRARNGHGNIITQSPKRCKYSDIASYINEWQTLRDQITKTGSSLSRKIEDMGRDYRDSIKRDELKKSQREKLDSVKTAMRYIKDIVESCMACDRIVTSHISHIDATISKYNKIINP